MKPGDVVLIRFPQADMVTGKLRPALVVAVAPGHHADLLLALITSRTYQTIPAFDEIIEISDDDYADSRLKVRSVVRLACLTSVEESVVNARLGNISPHRLEQVRQRLIAWLQK